MPQRMVYMNGAFVPELEARISLFDSAFMYGDMVFELTRSFKQKPYRLRDHMERLYGSLRYAEIDCGFGIAEMEEITRETVAHNLPALEGLEFHILHNVSRGGMPIYEELIKERSRPTVIIHTYPIIRTLGNMAKRYNRGAHFVVTPQQSVPSRYIDPKAKNRSRIYYKIADLQASRMGEDANALLTDERGFITEGTGNNIFVVHEGRISTPRPHNILRGVGRHCCMELADKLGMPVRETDIEPYDLRTADEAWYTSTTICMIPITRFNFQTIGDGKPGPVYRKILNAWCAEVGVDIPAQAREYAGLVETWHP